MGMTERELGRLVAAQRRAEQKYDAIEKKRMDALRSVREKFRPLEHAATMAVNDARAAVSRAELARAGIVPGKTVVLWQGKLWAVVLTYSGWTRLAPVTKDGKPHRGRVPAFTSRFDRLGIVPGITASGLPE